MSDFDLDYGGDEIGLASLRRRMKYAIARYNGKLMEQNESPYGTSPLVLLGQSLTNPLSLSSLLNLLLVHRNVWVKSLLDDSFSRIRLHVRPKAI